MTSTTYLFGATVLSVHDGDTLTVDLDLGMFVHRITTVRLRGCNARELSQPGGVEARDHLRSVLPVGTEVTVGTVKADKYGNRWEANVRLQDGSDLVTGLIAGQWAATWDGRGSRPLPPWPRTA